MSAVQQGEIASPSLPRQRLSDVLRAEIVRRRRPGGIAVGLWIAVALGLAFGGGMLAILLTVAPAVDAQLTDGTLRLAVTGSLEAAATGAIIPLMLAVTSAAARDTRGQFATALAVVPRRSRFLGARTLADVAYGGGTVLFTTGIIAALTVIFAQGAIYGDLVLLILLTATLAGIWLTILASALGVLFRSAVLAVLTVIGLMLVFPLVAGLVGGMLPAGASGVVTAISQAMPGALLVKAISVSTLSELGAGQILTGQLWLLAWTVVVGTAAWIVARRRDA